MAKLNVNGGGGVDIRPRWTPRQKIPSPLFRTQIRHSTNIQTRLTPRNKHVGSTIFTGSVAHRVVIGHVAELRRLSYVGQVRFPVGPFLRPELAVDEGAQGTGCFLVRPVQQRSVDETRDADLLTKQSPSDISCKHVRPVLKRTKVNWLNRKTIVKL